MTIQVAKAQEHGVLAEVVVDAICKETQERLCKKHWMNG